MERKMTPRYGLCIVGVVWLCSLTSCTEQISPPRVTRQVERIPFTPLSTLKSELSSSHVPMLVEFAQDYNCARCDQMTSTMDQIRSGFSNQVAIHRVNYLAAADSFQLRVCPTYLFVLDGEVVDRLDGKQAYPMLASRLYTMSKATSTQQSN